MLVNCTNHSYLGWSGVQKEAAGKWGKVLDFPFPEVPACADEGEIKKLADETVKQIIDLEPDAVMCQGEFTLTYAIVQGLKARGFTVVSACSERKVAEEHLPDGSVQKTSRFQFVRFREY